MKINGKHIIDVYADLEKGLVILYVKDGNNVVLPIPETLNNTQWYYLGFELGLLSALSASLGEDDYNSSVKYFEGQESVSNILDLLVVDKKEAGFEDE